MQLSVLIIWVVTGILVYEAVLCVIHPEHVDGKLIFMLAVTGIAVNLVNLAILGGHHGHSHREHADSHAEQGHGHASNGHNHAEDGDNHASRGHVQAEHGPDHDHHVHNQTIASHAPPQAAERTHNRMSLAMRRAVIHVLGDCIQSWGGDCCYHHLGEARVAHCRPCMHFHLCHCSDLHHQRFGI